MTNQDGPIKGFRPIIQNKDRMNPQPNTKPDNISLPPVSRAPGTTPSPLVSHTNLQQTSATIYCTHCGFANDPQHKFCSGCGQPLLSPASRNLPFMPGKPPQIHNPFTSAQTKSQTYPINSLLVGFGALIAFFCFFQSLITARIVNPVYFFGYGEESITIKTSMWNSMVLSSPTVEGLGPVNELTENLYDQLNIGALMYDYGTTEQQIGFTLGRIILFVVLLGSICCATVVGLNYSKRVSHKFAGSLILAVGGLSILLVILMGVGATTAFDALMTELFGDFAPIADTIFGVELGLGFWGSLIGFSCISIGGFLKFKEQP